VKTELHTHIRVQDPATGDFAVVTPPSVVERVGRMIADELELGVNVPPGSVQIVSVALVFMLGDEDAS